MNILPTKDIKNLTKEIEYTTSNEKGDTFKITAKYGKTNNERKMKIHGLGKWKDFENEI